MKTCQCEPFQNCELCKVDLSKPGLKEKKKIQKTKRLNIHNFDKPEKLHCRRCNGVGTAFRHLETFRKHNFGKGTGLKCDDRMTAWLCGLCDIEMSIKRPRKNDQLLYWQHAEEWLYLIIKTWMV